MFVGVGEGVIVLVAVSVGVKLGVGVLLGSGVLVQVGVIVGVREGVKVGNLVGIIGGGVLVITEIGATVDVLIYDLVGVGCALRMTDTKTYPNP